VVPAPFLAPAAAASVVVAEGTGSTPHKGLDEDDDAYGKDSESDGDEQIQLTPPVVVGQAALMRRVTLAERNVVFHPRAALLPPAEREEIVTDAVELERKQAAANALIELDGMIKRYASLPNNTPEQSEPCPVCLGPCIATIVLDCQAKHTMCAPCVLGIHRQNVMDGTGLRCPKCRGQVVTYRFLPIGKPPGDATAPPPFAYPALCDFVKTPRVKKPASDAQLMTTASVNVFQAVDVFQYVVETHCLAKPASDAKPMAPSMPVCVSQSANPETL
jgi:hypothetical protein